MLHISTSSSCVNNGRLLLMSCLSLTAIFTVIMFWIYISTLSGPVQIIYIDTESASNFITETNFLSIALDSGVIAENFKDFNMTNPKLIQMIRYLSPAYIRIGGNLADKLLFEPDSKTEDSEVVAYYMDDSKTDQVDYLLAPNFTMTGMQWLMLYQFTKKVHLELIFDLNALLRFENGSWDYRNALNMLKFSQDHSILSHWELGNEPNSYEHKFNDIVNASQLSKDFILLRETLNTFSLYKNSLLLGPDVTRPLNDHKESQKYLKEFLQKGGNTVSAITWHQYYLNGRIAHAEDFLNPTTLNLLNNQIKTIFDIVHTSPNPMRSVWLGETSSAYGGGAPNLSDTFIGSFLWIDKLGLAAQMGISVVIRQSIFKGHYALLDENYDPNPDWWVSILYKTLVDRHTVPFYTATTSRVRLYVHCTKKTFLNGMVPSVTIFGINLDAYTAKLRIEGLVHMNSSELLVYTYELTCDQKLTSKGIRLNGELLKMLPNNNLPIFVPKIQYINSLVTMPPLSIVFWVIPSKVKACF